MSEWQSIVGNSRVSSYGSCVRAYKPPSSYQKHFLKEGETLQGLAVKYDTTMEELRRINKLYGNDSIFLREHLLIPNLKGNLSTSNTDAGGSSTSSPKPNKVLEKIEKDKPETKSVDAASFLQNMDMEIKASKSALSSFQQANKVENLKKNSRTKLHKAADLASKEKADMFSDSNSSSSNSLFQL